MLLSMPCFPFSPSSACGTPTAWATQRVSDSDWCVLRLSNTKHHFLTEGSASVVFWTCFWKSSSVRVGPMVGLVIPPLTTSQLAVRHRVPWRVYSNSRFRGLPISMGRSGAFLCSACMPVFSSTLSVLTPSCAALWGADR